MFQPFDLVKTRIQNDSFQLPTTQATKRYKGSPGDKRLMSIVSHVVKHENRGMIGLWKGTAPSLIRTVPGIGLYFMSVDVLKGFLGNESPSAIEAAVIGVTARGISGLILHPITVIKTRFESGQFKYRSLGHALQDVYFKDGLKGLYKGWTPTVLRDAPYSGLYYMFYSQLKIYLQSSSCMSLSNNAYVTFACGLSAGLFASLATQPFDVIKTKMQLQSSTYKNILAASIIIFKSKGINGFFAGATPRIMRRSLMSAISWTFFDTLSKAFNQK